ncbi:hypothetical protein C4D60_Mb08t21510 [Musa balbisiana]|uniref:Uncharacterized protein n=1 Tax=Musa balbisiana TaxID=52838 RepID=A0A4S8K5F0_MUSBA|nr:hypothetical protein C4D60_Mb08t21510 [Musa balbisiana]
MEPTLPKAQGTAPQNCLATSQSNFSSQAIKASPCHNQCHATLQPNQQEEHPHAQCQNPYQGVARQVLSRKARDGTVSHTPRRWPHEGTISPLEDWSPCQTRVRPTLIQ